MKNKIWETRRERVAETCESYAATKISSSGDAIEFVKRKYGGYFDCRDTEEFHAIVLDTKNQVTSCFRISIGTLDASLVHPREVFKPAILDSASSIILVHNHPSGVAAPSREDKQVTDRLTEAGKLLGVDVLDHIVYGSQTDTQSIRESD